MFISDEKKAFYTRWIIYFLWIFLGFCKQGRETDIQTTYSISQKRTNAKIKNDSYETIKKAYEGYKFVCLNIWLSVFSSIHLCSFLKSLKYYQVIPYDMHTSKPHISVCICTFKRPNLLEKLLNRFENQETEELFSFSIIVVDNDFQKSAKNIVKSFQEKTNFDVEYYAEPEQNIALARNMAVENAQGEFIAFIDDDELPSRCWLINLYKACGEFHADGVLGPVIPHYEGNPPNWIVRGKFYERPSHSTGEVLHWTNTRTGNVMLKRQIFNDQENLFRKEFGSGGEDRDFFRRLIAKGFRFVWCAQAPVCEAVTAVRCTRSFMLRRALLRGKLPHFTTVDYVKSLVAVPFYTAILPFLLVAGHHLFMKYLIKSFDHIGRLLDLCGITVIKEKYVVE